MTLFIIAVVFAVIATVLAYVCLVPEKKAANLNGFGKFLHNVVNFKSLIIEKILQALYIFSTALIILIGFFMLFYVDEYFDVWMGGYGILLMLIGPIVVRLIYESAMMVILLVKNVIQINNKLKNQNEDEEATSPFAEKISFPMPTISVTPAEPAPAAAPVVPVAPVPAAAPVVPAAPEPVSAAPAFCANCGTPVGDGVFCANCGAKVK